MTPWTLLHCAIGPALELLGARYDTPEARALLLAIALQESGLRHRVQQDGDANEYDDALSWWQFERIGVAEVLRHPASATHARMLCVDLGYPADVETVYRAMRDNDVLAAGIARLALWRHPDALPVRGSPVTAWEYYLKIWAPGKPHSAPWAARYSAAWEFVI